MRNANNGSALQYINAFYIINECIRVYLLPIGPIQSEALSSQI